MREFQYEQFKIVLTYSVKNQLRWWHLYKSRSLLVVLYPQSLWKRLSLWLTISKTLAAIFNRNFKQNHYNSRDNYCQMLHSRSIKLNNSITWSVYIQPEAENQLNINKAISFRQIRIFIFLKDTVIFQSKSS